MAPNIVNPPQLKPIEPKILSELVKQNTLLEAILRKISAIEEKID